MKKEYSYEEEEEQKKKRGKRKKKRKKKKKLRIIIFLELLVICLFLPILFLYLQIDKIENFDMSDVTIDENKINDENIKDYQNIVVYGVDSRENDLKKNTRTDSIMIISIHKKTKAVKIASVFRDTYVYIDSKHGYTKINHSYAYGGPELAISTLNRNFDLDVKDFVTVNFSALTHIVDKLGGITLDIKEEELQWVNKYTKDVAKINGTTATYLKKTGKQKVTGTQATAYCRVRYTSGGDFTRAQRQRTVLEQIFKKAKKSSIPTLVSLINEMAPQIYTSLDKKDIFILASAIFSYDIKETKGFPFDNSPQMINGASVVVPTTLSSNVTKLHEFLFDTKDYIPSNTVQGYSK